jgi:STE24 endopeptidase
MSKCPVDFEKITAALNKMNKLLELPWQPLYTQSGGGSSNNDSTLAYWSLAATVAFTVFVYSFEGSLDARQKAAYQKTIFPKELETTVSKIDAEQEKETDKKEGEPKSLLGRLKEKFKSSQAYGLDKINFGMFASTYDTFESVAFLLLGFLPYLWDKSVELGQAYFNLSAADDEIKVSLIFLGLVTVLGTVTSLPFELYSTFNIEKKHGFNKQTLGLFFTDKIKSLVLTCLIGGPFIALLLKIIKVN